MISLDTTRVKTNILQPVQEIKVQGTDESNGARKYLIEIPPGGIMQAISVTTMISIFADEKQWLKDWRDAVGEERANEVSRIASDRGTAMHDTLEKIVLGQQFNPLRLRPNIVAQVSGITAAINENMQEINAVETFLYSPIIRIAGRTDLIGVWKKQKAIIDFKTSKRLIESEKDIEDYFVQLGCYALMAKYMYNIDCTKVVVIVGVDFQTKPQIFEKSLFACLPLMQKVIKRYMESELWEEQENQYQKHLH